MADYISPPFESEPIQVEAAVYEYIRLVFPNWNPKEPHLATIFTEAIAEQIAKLMRLAQDVPPEIFKYFGRLVDILPDNATYAYASTTWTMVDNAGYTIPEGTALRLLIGGDEYAIFETIEDTVIAPGATVVAGVTVKAQEEGAEASGLDSDPELMDILDYVSTVTLDGPTSGGNDAEDIDSYLSRLSTRLQLLADRPILPRDFEIYAESVAGVARAVAVDGYNPANATFNNERMVTLYLMTETGANVGQPVKDAVQGLLEAAREVNFIINIADPTQTVIAVVSTVRATPGIDTAALDASVTAAVLAYLSSATWGTPRWDDTRKWVNTMVVRHYEIAEVINNVTGVDYIESLTLNGNPNVDVALGGVVGVPAPTSTAAITVNAAA